MKKLVKYQDSYLLLSKDKIKPYSFYFDLSLFKLYEYTSDRYVNLSYYWKVIGGLKEINKLDLSQIDLNSFISICDVEAILVNNIYKITKK